MRDRVSLEYEKAWDNFGDRVGWIVESSWISSDSEVTFDTSSPRGHLPCVLPLRQLTSLNRRLIDLPPLP